MKAIEFKEQMVIVAKDQKEYKPLPAYVSDGILVCCFELSKKELKKTLETKNAKIVILNFNGPVQPMEVRTIKPEFPVDFRLALNCNPESWDLDNRTATLSFDFSDEEMEALKADGLFWVIIAIRDSPLLPINNDLVC